MSMKKIMLMVCVAVFANVMISCFPSENDKNAEDYGTQPEKKNAPVPALPDLAGQGQKVMAPASTPQPETASAMNSKEVTKIEKPQSNLNGESLIAKSDCLVCHKLHEKSIGPAYDKVAQKYNSTDANINLLADKVIKGGTGVWGAMPMTPHPTLKEEEVKAMVKYILTVKAE